MPPLAGIHALTCGPPTLCPTFTTPLTFPSGSGGTNVDSMDFHAKQPYLIQWNLAVEQKLPGNTVLTLGYVGTRGVHLWQSEDANTVLPTSIVNGAPFWNPAILGPKAAAGCLSIVPTCRANPNLGANTQIESHGETFYNGLQVGVNKRLGHGLQFQANYVWSKLLDNSAGILADQSGQVTDPLFNKKFDWGPAPYNVKHNLRINALYRIPSMKGDGLAAKVTGGWWLGGIVSAQSGFPFSPTLGYFSSLSDATNSGIVRARQLCDRFKPGPSAGTESEGCSVQRGTVIQRTPNQWFNPNMFTVNAAGSHGTVGRNVLTGPNLTDVDLSVNKDTAIRKLGEGGNLQFRAEVFNLMNHPNLGPPSASSIFGSATGAISQSAGVISSTITTSRQIQLALKLVF